MNVVTRVRVNITRADGTIVPIGVIKGGYWYERLVARIRLWFANRAARAQR